MNTDKIEKNLSQVVNNSIALENVNIEIREEEKQNPDSRRIGK